MAGVVIHAPKTMVANQQKRSFQTTVQMAVGDGYAFTRNELAQITPGCTVVVLDKPARQRAEGQLVALVPTQYWTGNGIQRFDVQMANLRIVPFQPVQLNRRGVAII